MAKRILTTLKKEQVRLRLSQSDLAKIMNVSSSYLSFFKKNASGRALSKNLEKKVNCLLSLLKGIETLGLESDFDESNKKYLRKKKVAVNRIAKVFSKKFKEIKAIEKTTKEK